MEVWKYKLLKLLEDPRQMKEPLRNLKFFDDEDSDGTSA